MSDRPVSSGPAVLAAVLAVAALALITSAARYALVLLDVSSLYLVPVQSPLIWPFPRRLSPALLGICVGQLVLLCLITFLVGRLGIRAAAPHRGFWAVLFSVWFAAVVGGYLVAPVATPWYYAGTSTQPEFLVQTALAAAAGGGGWGLYVGWIGGLVAALVHSSAARRVPL